MDVNVRKICPNCSQLYTFQSPSQNATNNLPLFLSCGHSMCEKCIRDIVKFEEPIECKVCHQDTKIPSANLPALNNTDFYATFPVNVYLLGELTLKLLENPSKIVYKPDEDFYINLRALLQDNNEGRCMECQQCTSKMCRQCSTILCETCFNKSHKNFIIFKNHFLQNIAQQVEIKYCSVHKEKQLDYFCKDCSKTICMDCMIVSGDKSCKNHNVNSMTEAVDDLMIEIKKVAPRVDETFKRLTKTAVNVGNLLYDISNETGSQTHLSQTMADIEQHFSKLFHKIQKHKQEIIDIVETHKKSEKESLETAKNDITEAIKKAHNVMKSIESTKDPEKIVQMNLWSLLEDAKQVAESPWFLAKDEDKKDQIKIAVNEDLCNLITDYMSLEGNARSTYHLRTTAELGDIEIPPPPPAPVYPPELPKDVRQKQLQKVIKECDKDMQKGPAFFKAPPHYRSKSSSVTSLNSHSSDSSNKSYQKYNSPPHQNMQIYADMYKKQEVVEPVRSFVDSHHPKQLCEGTQELIYISHIISPHDFYVQRACHQNLVKEMLREFNNALSLPKPTLNHAVEGKIYLAFNNADNMWQRGRIMSIDRKDPKNPIYNVFCMDFGSSEIVTIDKLRLLPPARVQSPLPLAINCALANCEPRGGAWTNDDAYLIQKIIDNKQAVIHVRRMNYNANGSMKVECDVTTYEDGVSVAHALVFHERARMPQPKLSYPVPVGMREIRKLFIGSKDFKHKAVEEVYITCVVSPDKFYVRKQHLQNIYEKLGEDLEQEYSSNANTGTVYLPEVGMAVAVKLPPAECGGGAGAVCARGVGAACARGVSAACARGVSAACARGVGAACACGMGAACARGVSAACARGVSAACARGVGAACACGMGAACARGVSAACARGVSAACARGVGAACACGMGAACARGVSAACARGVGAACAHGVSAACARGVSAASARGLGAACARGVVLELAARARVRVLLPDTGHVLLLHYSALRHLHRHFTTLAALATECHLSGVTPLNRKWSTGAVALMQKYEDKLLELHVEDNRNRNSIGVTLYDNSDPDNIICINNEMIKYKFAVSFGLFHFNTDNDYKDQVITNKHPLHDKDNMTVMKREMPTTTQHDDLEAKDKGPLRLEARVLYYQSPSLIYVSLVHQQKIFTELFEKMRKYYGKNTTIGKEGWKVDDRCCAICIQSKTWRRAVILELEGENAKIFYCDFAFIETVPIVNLRELISEFRSIGDAAIKCHLGGVIPAVGEQWPTLTKEYLKELLDAYKRVFITKLGKFKNKSMPIEIWVYHTVQGGALDPNQSEWRCLNKKIIEQGLGIPDKSQEVTTAESNVENDEMLSFLNVQGSVHDWLQLEPMPMKPFVFKSVPDNESNTSAPVDFKDGDERPEDSNVLFLSDWLPPEPFTKNEFMAMPTYIDNDGIIYLHDTNQKATLELIRKALEVRFKNIDPKAKFAKWTVGEPCVAQYFLDNRFYRGKIISVNEEASTCLIQYIDYGNEEICPFANIRKGFTLHQIPTQAHKCILSRIKPVEQKWDRLTLDYIHKSVVEKECFIKITEGKSGGITPIELKYDKLCINDHLVDFEMAVYTDGSRPVVKKFLAKEEYKVTETVANESLDSGPDYIVENDVENTQPQSTNESIDMQSMQERDLAQMLEDDNDSTEANYITYPSHNYTRFKCNIWLINDPNLLELNIIHDEDTAEEYDQMFKEVDARASNMSPINGILENKACIALFLEDNIWYRASILEYSESQNKIKVRFVDYGNIAIVSLADVREIREKWAKLPPASLTARLYGIKLNPDMQLDDITQEYINILLDKGPFDTTIIDRVDDIASVELRNENGDLINEILTMNNIFVKCDNVDTD